jgi:hypothetical protein
VDTEVIQAIGRLADSVGCELGVALSVDSRQEENKKDYYQHELGM